MAHYTGKNLYVRWIYNGSTVVLTGDQRSFEFDRNVDTVDTSAGSDDYRTYLPTIKDASMSMTLLDNSTAGSAARRNLVPGYSGTLEWGPEGTQTGKPKYGVPCFVTEFSTAYPYDDVVEYNVAWQADGQWLTNYEELGSTWS